MGPRLFSRGNRAPREALATLPAASMGPRLFSRGNGHLWILYLNLRDASMGPRLFSRGNHHHRGVASMGPRLFSRGNQNLEDKRPGVGVSFNGAAAFQPRKSARRYSSPPFSIASMGPRLFSRGNGAIRLRADPTAHASMGPRLFSRGNPDHVRAFVHAIPTASMGPRLFSRGNHNGHIHGYGHRALQWGRGFSAAEIPWRMGSREHPLQASMGPRLFSRGNVTKFVEHTSPISASMGPRLFSRGNVTRRSCLTTRWRLQWGRGFSAAEMDRLPPKKAGRGQASMGPRLFSRGNQVQNSNRNQTSMGFNGAAAFQPRKLCEQCGSHLTRGPLQWGRGFSAAEMSYRELWTPFNPVASMGPRLFSRGNPARSARTGGGGYASMGPRLFSRGNSRGPGPGLLGVWASMGPRLFSRGNHLAEAITQSNTKASMGPRLFSRGNGIWLCACFLALLLARCEHIPTPSMLLS